MEHSLYFGSPRRWLVLWTGSSDPIEKKHLKVAFHNLGACDVQTGKWKKENNSTLLNKLLPHQSKC